MTTYYGNDTNELLFSFILLSENPVDFIYYDNILGFGGDDTIYGGGFDDYLNGGDGNDTIFGYTGSDNIIGHHGSDNLNGEDGNDGLSGGDGNDALSGGNGNDALSGDSGADYLTGGAGKDAFGYVTASDSLVGLGKDTIADFTPGVDKLNLAGVDANASLAGNQAFSTAQIVYLGGIATIDILGSSQDMQIKFIGSPNINWTDVIL